MLQKIKYECAPVASVLLPVAVFAQLSRRSGWIMLQIICWYTTNRAAGQASHTAKKKLITLKKYFLRGKAGMPG